MRRYYRAEVFRRPRSVPVQAYDADADRWRAAGDTGATDRRDSLTVTTFNVWYHQYFAATRHRAIADLIDDAAPDVAVFQEVTPDALAVFLGQPWARRYYRCAAVVDRSTGDYGMLLLSRMPIARITYTRLPTRMSRGYLRAEFAINGRRLVICSIHLDSGKQSRRLRARQLRRIFRSLRSAQNAVVLGDFNMRDEENRRIVAPYTDAWPALRPRDAGYTEDTAINHMRFDSKGKDRQVRFDRVLTKGTDWRPAEIDLMGTRPVSSAQPRVFPSDHFGVSCRLIPG